MKMSLGKRLVLLVHWLLSFAACLALLFFCISPNAMGRVAEYINALMGARGAEIAGVALLVIYAVFAALSLIFILNAKKKDDESGFITVISDDTGKTRIAVGAIEQMIRIAVRGVEGIADLKTVISNETDAISISASVAVISGVHIPTVTANIQRTISNYIELNCGVSVREVSVSVSALETPDETGKRGRKKFGKAISGSAPVAIEEAPAAKPAEPETVYIPEVSEPESEIAQEGEEA